jgi:hypothetical protein
METLSNATSRQIWLPPGRVELSVAEHADGAVSVVAWEVETGRRVGLITQLAYRPDVAPTREVEPAYAAAGLAELLDAAWRAAAVGRPALAEDTVLLRAGVLTAAELADLRGLQWLLAELGEYRSLAELVIEYLDREPLVTAGAAPGESGAARVAPV